MSPADMLTLTWDEIHRDCRRLADKLRALGPFTGIVGVARGGLVPAALLAGELDCRLVETLCIASYDGCDQREVEIIKALDGDGGGWLVVDDLVDSGTTAREIRTMLPKAHFATLYAKPAGLALVDTFVTEVAQHVWIVFPWETPPRREE